MHCKVKVESTRLNTQIIFFQRVTKYKTFHCNPKFSYKSCFKANPAYPGFFTANYNYLKHDPIHIQQNLIFKCEWATRCSLIIIWRTAGVANLIKLLLPRSGYVDLSLQAHVCLALYIINYEPQFGIIIILGKIYLNLKDVSWSYRVLLVSRNINCPIGLVIASASIKRVVLR